MNRRLIYIAKRIAFVPVGTFTVITLTFLLVNVIPSDPARVIAGQTATRAEVNEINHQLGLNNPIWTRYYDYLKALILHGSLGHSYFGGRSVWADIGEYLPASVELMFFALIVATVLGIFVGALGAYFENRFVDKVTMPGVVLTMTTPDFVLGLVMIFFLFYKWKIFPAATGQAGVLSPIDPGPTNAYMVDGIIHGNSSMFSTGLTHLIMPMLALGITNSALFMLYTRQTLSRSLSSFQVEFARACGLSERKAFGYAFAAARTQTITYIGSLMAFLIGGDVIIERVFAWQGIGQFLVARITSLDLPEIMGIVLILTMITLTTFVLIDVVVASRDPRVTFE